MSERGRANCLLDPLTKIGNKIFKIYGQSLAMGSRTGLSLSCMAAVAFGIMAAVAVPGTGSAEAHHGSSGAVTTVSAINEEISLQKTVVAMSIPEDNLLPWGAVSGTVSDHVRGHPAIIQIYKEGEPVRFAQVDVEEDGSYEYKFRIRNLDVATGEFVNVFEGAYTVKIFNVIPNGDSQI